MRKGIIYWEALLGLVFHFLGAFFGFAAYFLAAAFHGIASFIGAAFHSVPGSLGYIASSILSVFEGLADIGFAGFSYNFLCAIVPYFYLRSGGSLCECSGSESRKCE